MSRHLVRLALIGAVVGSTAVVACSDSTGPGTGTLRVQLTDAPFASDSVRRVDVHVLRVDTKLVESDSAEAARAATGDSSSRAGWTTVATPDRTIELLALRNGITTTLGLSTLPAGSYRSFRLVIDPSRSSVTLKNGAVLTSTSTPNVSFPSAATSGIKINLTRPVVIVANDTTTTVVDFDVDQSFVMRSGSIASSGLTFRPVVRVKNVTQ